MSLSPACQGIKQAAARIGKAQDLAAFVESLSCRVVQCPSELPYLHL